MSDGSITFSTRLDNSDMEKDLKRTEGRIESLKSKVEGAETDKTVIEKMMERGEQSIKDTEAEIDRLKAKLAELGGVKPTDAGYTGAQAGMGQARAQLEEAQANLNKQLKRQDALNDKWQDADAKVEAYNDRLSSAKERAAELGARLQESMAEGGDAAPAVGDGLGESAQRGAQSAAASSIKIGGAFDKLGARIQKTMKKAFVITTIVQLVRALKSNIIDVAMQNQRFAAGVENLKAIFRGFIGGVVQMLLPAMTAFVNMVGAMLQALVKLIDTVFHTGFGKAVQQQRDQAKAAVDQANAEKRADYEKKAAKEAAREAKAMRKLAKATKEASRQLMSFDELNVMAAESASDAASAADAYTPEQVEQPTYDTSWTDQMPGKIDAALAKIMIVLGAAIMAVGAILCFSGANIPLGIALMVVGALMVYTAVTEQWGSLSDKTKSELLALIGVIGALILAIGVVLLLVGQVPLGIAAVVAGIGMMVAAVALNWGLMDKKTQQSLTALMRVVGGFLLVLGVVLLVTGAGIPVGVAAVLAGTALLVGSAALDWDAMPRAARDFVSAIMAVAGAALVVLGIILCVTGVGIPLGVACILAGVGSFVTAAALNWGFLKDKVKEVWSGIVQWWRGGPAKVFTLKWWRNLFKSVANGLIRALNACIGAVGNFFGWMGAGINSLLAGTGVQLPSIPPPVSIPYLAGGAVIPPNRRFMAVLGDQTSGRNLEAPEGLIRQIVREESGAGDVSGLLSDILEAVRAGSSIYVDRRVLGRVAGEEMASMARMGGL